MTDADVKAVNDIDWSEGIGWENGTKKKPKWHATFAEWLKDNQVPDLQAMAERYGGLGNVPRQVWEKFDLAMQAWEVRRKLRHLE